MALWASEQKWGLDWTKHDWTGVNALWQFLHLKYPLFPWLPCMTTRGTAMRKNYFVIPCHGHIVEQILSEKSRILRRRRTLYAVTVASTRHQHRPLPRWWSGNKPAHQPANPAGPAEDRRHHAEEWPEDPRGRGHRLEVNFLDITLNLATESYKPYHKPGETINYVHVDSNHPPPSIIKNQRWNLSIPSVPAAV